MNYWHMLAEGLAIGVMAVAFVVTWMLISERQDRRRARYLSRLEKEMTGEAEPCVMEGTGDGRVCRLCGRHPDEHMNGLYHRDGAA